MDTPRETMNRQQSERLQMARKIKRAMARIGAQQVDGHLVRSPRPRCEACGDPAAPGRRHCDECRAELEARAERRP
jgi:uncharacterized OB-fold protein